MKKRTPEEQREYMRQYRARTAGAKPTEESSPPERFVLPDLPPVTDQKQEPSSVAHAAAGITNLENRLKRQQTTGKRINPYHDGMPDWPELIQNMSQKSRDDILDKISKHRP